MGSPDQWFHIMMATVIGFFGSWFFVKVLPMMKPPPPRPQPKVEPKPEPPQDGGKMVASRPPIICSIELSPRELFDMIAHGALDKAGRSELKDHNWTVTIDLNQSRTGIKRVVVEVEGTTKKERGHLWLVKE